MECNWKNLEDNEEHNIYVLFNKLAARLCHCEGVSLLPYEDDDLPSINKGPDVPKDQEKLINTAINRI